ncbi:GUN4 domain-containing protein, partial [Cylindrospermopsis raciborskii CS-506_B]
KELRTIDNLWLKYSQGKFGISVQQEIYKNLGGTKFYDSDRWESFGDRVGWRKQGSWLYWSDLNFSLSAPTGHLPVYLVFFDWRGLIRFTVLPYWCVFGYVFPPVKTCRV